VESDCGWVLLNPPAEISIGFILLLHRVKSNIPPLWFLPSLRPFTTPLSTKGTTTTKTRKIIS
jgi:hypothetical protein